MEKLKSINPNVNWTIGKTGARKAEKGGNGISINGEESSVPLDNTQPFGTAPTNEDIIFEFLEGWAEDEQAK